MYKRILLAYDGSEPGQQALLDCREIAQWSQSELFLVAVMPLPLATIGPDGGVYGKDVEAAEKEDYQAVLESGLRRLTDAGLKAQGQVVTGDSVDEIVRYAHAIKADLIVVGHKHLDGWAARWWRGSVSKVLIEHAPCSVLVVITH
jgi:nucleotide-binding universal stress UspA family protein